MIYLDNSATTKPHPEVLEAFVKVNKDFWANPSSSHGLGSKAEMLLSRARLQVAEVLGAEANEIIFTSGGTEGNNIAIKGIVSRYLNRGNHIITSAIEHPSVAKPFAGLQSLGFRITTLPVNEDGQISLVDLKDSMCDDTILVSIMHVNNEIGTIAPLEEIGKIVHTYKKAFFHVDGVQGFSKVPLDLHRSHIDLYSLSGHKFHGLKGTGILFVRAGVRLDSVIAGGGQEQQIRGGTVNVAGAVAIAKAMRLMSEENTDEMLKLRDYFCGQLCKIPAVILNTPVHAQAAPHIINFSIPGINSEVFMRMLEEKEIYVSTTSACSSKTKKISEVVKSLGKSDQIAASAIRVSLSFETDKSELDAVLEAIRETLDKIKVL